MSKKYSYQLTSDEATIILALLRVEINHEKEWVKSCEEDGDDECRMVAEKRLAETQVLYSSLNVQHINRFSGGKAMRGKVWGGILAVMSVIGMISLGAHFTGRTSEIALFVIFALFAADGVTTIAADCWRWDDEEKIRDGKER